MPNTDKLHPRALSIRQLFTDSDAWYAIPPYQRPYRWAADEVNAMWDDLKTAYENNSEEIYFLGSIITAKQHAKKHLDIIDGQQRLTTLIILFSVIRDFYPEINEKSDNALAIKKFHIENSIGNYEEGERLQLRKRFIPRDSAASDFCKTVTDPLATKNTINSEGSPSKQKLKGDDPNFNFINSVHILKNKVDDLGNDLGKFVDFIFNQVHVIRIDCANGESAITLFQVLNVRGMDLRSSDLVKSFLLEQLGSICKGDDDALITFQQEFMSDWHSMESDIAGDENKSMIMDDMLALYMCYVLAKAPGKDLSSKFRDKFLERRKKDERETPNKVLKDFKDFSESHADLFQENVALYALRYTNWPMHWESILLTALHLKYESNDFTKLAQALRRYYYICWIAGKNLTTIKKPSFKIIERLKEGINDKSNTINQINKDLRELVDKGTDSILITAKNKLNSPNVEESWIKPLLLLIEYNNPKDDSTSLHFIPLDSSLHLEHVLPQTPDDKEWKISKGVSDKYLHSGGNLTLLGGRKNVIASNKKFSIKISAYKGQREPNGKITSYKITQIIASDYDEWNEKSMCTRKEWFLSEVSKILDLGTWPKI